ncbi:hypothetical protein J4437_05105 [Candidatus Woesearchaeota archaeon]|nr:hypothetical protein [Candidatus Woesearchaeota archaeon]
MIKQFERAYLSNFESGLNFVSVEFSNFHLMEDYSHFNTLHSGKDLFILPIKKKPVKRRMSHFNHSNSGYYSYK